MRRVALLLLLLLVPSCQPYLDHELPVYNFSKEFVDFGHKRRLRLLTIEGNEHSLLLVFNQPLRLVGAEGGLPPFEAQISPRLPIKEVQMEGLAGVRYRFTRPAPAAQEYRVTIPAGWRALSGASYLSKTTHIWETSRPELTSLLSEPGSRTTGTLLLDPESSALMTWNQAVSEESLRSCLRLESSHGESADFTLRATDDTRKRFQITFEGVRSGLDYRLRMAPGVKGVEGQLTSEQSLEWRVAADLELKLLSPGKVRLDSSNRATLEFSDIVAEKELRRMLRLTDGGMVEVETQPDGRHFTIQVDAPQAKELVLLGGLKGDRGTELPQDITLPLVRPTLVDQVFAPLTPLTLKPGSVSFPELATKGGRTVTWRLSFAQALAISGLAESQWGQGNKLAWESGKPLFQTPEAKGSSAPTDGESAESGKPKGPPQHQLFLPTKSPQGFGFYLVRRTSGGKTTRVLLNRSDLKLTYLVEPGAVQVSGRSRRLSRPRPGAVAELVDSKGLVLASKRLDGEGRARFEIQDSWKPYAVSLRWGKDRTFLPLQGLKPATSGPSSVLSALDRLHYQPGQGAVLYGFVFAPGAPTERGRLSMRILNSAGQEVQPACPVPLNSWGMFEAHFFVPDREGLFQVELQHAREGKPVELELQKLRVGKQLKQHEEYGFTISEESLSGDVVTGKLNLSGSRHDEIVLRAILWPDPDQQVTNGWRLELAPRPAWEELPVEINPSTEDFRITLPADRVGSQVLQMELVEPLPGGQEWELAERQRKLPLSGPQLSLTASGVEPQLGTSQQIALELEGSSEAPELLEARLFYRELESDPSQWQEIDLHQFGESTQGQPWPVSFALPGHYRIDGIATGNSLGLLLRSWSTRVNAPPTEQQFQLKLEPSLAVPGQAVTPVLRGLAPGVGVNLTLFGGDQQWAREQIIPASGRLPSFEAPAARSDRLTLFASALPEPQVGVQRVRPLVSKAELKLDASARIRDLEFRLPTSVEAAEPLSVGLVSSKEGGPIRGFLLCREKKSLYQAELVSLYHWLTGQSQELPSEAETETQLTLSRSVQNNFFRGGVVVDGEAVLPLTAPTEPGHYHWYFVGWDDSGRVAQTSATIEVTPTSQWTAMTPSAVRESDTFDAGLKFEAAPDELAPLGLTASISEQGTLEPSTYFQTSALVDPGAEDDLIFHYFLPEGARDEVSLHWNLGLEGRRHEHWAEVPVIAAPTIGRDIRRGRLGSSGRIRLDVDRIEQWALWIRSVGGAKATVEVRHPRGSHGPLTVEGTRPQQRVTGRGPGAVELLHQEGEAVDYVLQELLPDDGASQSAGSQLYLMRSIRDEEGKPVNLERLRRGSRYEVVLHVLNPSVQWDVSCRIPLPGGAVPERVLEKDFHPDWDWESGEIRFQLARLPVGEYTYRVQFRAETSGVYLWPFSEIQDNQGHVLAHSGSGRVGIVD